jgi:hypothetical protein
MVGMSLTSCLFRRRHSAKGTVVKKIPLFNKNMLHLIDDIFWNLGFKNETQAEKVMVIIRIILIINILLLIFLISIIPIILIMSQVRVAVGIADHVWQEKRAAISATVDGLGDRFKPELRAGWLASVRPIPMGRLRQLPQWERRLWCLVIESLRLLVCSSLISSGECADWQLFCNEYAPKSHF